jgi:class 3 adenylate cyclase
MTFLGDAMMAVFGSQGNDPGAPSQAVRCALAMQQRLVELNAEWTGRELPTMRIGVGINTGEVMIGHVGFTGRYEFAAMGDNTNLAARLEKLTRQHQAGIIISGSTQSKLERGFATQSLGTTQVKGRQAEVHIYQVIQP